MDLLGAARMMTQKANDMLDKIEEVKNTVGLTDEDSQPFVDAPTLLPTLKPGDLIEINNDESSSSGNHNWVMYSDMPGFVFCFEVEDQNNSTEAKVTLKKLTEVAAAGCRVRRNNKSKIKNLKLKPVNDILTEAKSCLDTLVPFSGLSGAVINSEYYVTKWRFGEVSTTEEGVNKDSGGAGIGWLGSRIFGMLK